MFVSFEVLNFKLVIVLGILLVILIIVIIIFWLYLDVFLLGRV